MTEPRGQRPLRWYFRRNKAVTISVEKEKVMKAIFIMMLVLAIVYASQWEPSKPTSPSAPAKSPVAEATAKLGAFLSQSYQVEKNGGPDVVRKLISEGALVNSVVKVSGINKGMNMLSLAAQVLPPSKEIVTMLIEAGADVNGRNTIKITNNREGTPILAAANCGNIEIVQLLLEAGADINAKNVWDDNILMVAVSNPFSNPELVQLLIDKGVDVNAENSSGYTPLMSLARDCMVSERYREIDEKILWLLIANGADVNHKGHYGETPLNLARHPEVFGILRAAGATE